MSNQLAPTMKALGEGKIGAIIGLTEMCALVEVQSDDDLEYAQTLVPQASESLKEIEAARKQLVDPYNQHLRLINQSFKALADPLTQAARTLRARIGEYLDNKAAIVSSAEPAADELEVAAPVAPDTSSIETGSVLTYEIESLGKFLEWLGKAMEAGTLPEGFDGIVKQQDFENKRAILRYIKRTSGHISIPGLHYVRKTTVKAKRD